jgi:hypothetical protein
LLDPFADALGCDAAGPNLRDVLQTTLRDQVFDPFLDGGVRGVFGQTADACRNGVQIDVGSDRQDGFLVEDRDGFVASLKEGASAVLL